MAYKEKIAGIYKIQRIGADQCYVGSSSHIAVRGTVHFNKLRKGVHHSLHMQNVWNKDGPEALEFQLLETVCGEGEELKRLLKEREEYWMEVLAPAFNTLPAAYSLLGNKRTKESIQKTADGLRGRKRPPDVVARIAESNRGQKRTPEQIEKRAATRRGTKQTDEWKAKIKAAVTGLKRSPETIERLRQANLGKKMSDEAREKMRVSQTGKKRTPESVAKSAAAHRGKIVSVETREKLRANGLAQAERRRSAMK